MAVDTRKSNEVYGLNQPLVGVVGAPIVSRRAPTTADKAQLGQMWINTASGIVYFLGSVVGTTYTWFTGATVAASYAAATFVTAGTFMQAGTTIAAGTTITAGTGLTVTAGGANVTGNSIVTGTLQVTAGQTIDAGGLVVTAGNSSFGDDLVIGGTLKSNDGLVVLDAGTGILITGTVNINSIGAAVTNLGYGALATGNVSIGNFVGTTRIFGLDIIMGLGDDAGADKISIIDSAFAEVASIDSDGNVIAADVQGDTFTIGAAGPQILAGAGNPAGAATKGTLYIKTDAAGANDRLWIESDGAGTWVYFAASA